MAAVMAGGLSRKAFFDEMNISLNESDVKRIYRTLDEIDFNKWKTKNHIIQNYTEQATGFCVHDAIELSFKNGVSFLCLYPKCEEFKKIIEITEAIIADKIIIDDSNNEPTVG